MLYVGRLLPHKGINYLVDAVEADTRCCWPADAGATRRALLGALLDERAPANRSSFVKTSMMRRL